MDDLHSPCVGMGDGLTASDLRAEIARLRVEVLARSEDLSAAMARTNGLEEANRTLRAELDAAKADRDSASAALAKERAEILESVVALCAIVDALATSRMPKNLISAVRDFVAEERASRAAEAKEPPHA